MTLQPSALWFRLTKYCARCWPGARCEMSVLYLEFGSWARMVPGPGCCCLCYKLIKLGQLRHLAATNNSSLWPRIADIICFHTQPPTTSPAATSPTRWSGHRSTRGNKHHKLTNIPVKIEILCRYGTLHAVCCCLLLLMISKLPSQSFNDPLWCLSLIRYNCYWVPGEFNSVWRGVWAQSNSVVSSIQN